MGAGRERAATIAFMVTCEAQKSPSRVIEECARLKLPYLTLFAFSTENWFRPVEEVGFLMHPA